MGGCRFGCALRSPLRPEVSCCTSMGAAVFGCSRLGCCRQSASSEALACRHACTCLTLQGLDQGRPCSLDGLPRVSHLSLLGTWVMSIRVQSPRLQLSNLPQSTGQCLPSTVDAKNSDTTLA